MMDEFRNNQHSDQQPNGEYHYSYQDNGQRAEQQPIYNPYSTDPYKTKNTPPKPGDPKKPKKFGLGAVIASALCAAILCGAISTVGVASYFNSKSQTAGVSSETSAGSASSAVAPVTNITVNDETDNIAIAVAQKASQSVVGIRVTYVTQVQSFFGSTKREATSEGSGVIYKENGYIITNYHVISGAVAEANYGEIASGAKIEVFLPNDTSTAISAAVVGFDASADLALIKIDRTELAAVEIGDSDSLKVGQVAVAIGNPGGLEYMNSVSKGIVSGLNRTITTEDNVQMNLIQTDAAINPGNSGGALVDQNGKLIGINNAKMSGTNYDGMGFSIPVNEVVEICDRLISKEGQASAYLGISINTYYDAETLQRMGYPAGVVVASVADGSPAGVAGIQKNDIITKINGAAVTSYAAMISEKNKYNAGDTVTVTVYRGGQTADVSVTLGSGNSAQ